MTKQFVLDTNTLVSAFILLESKSRKAYNKAFDDGILLYSTPTFNEFADTFIRQKFEKYFSLERRLSAIDEFKIKGFLIEANLLITASRDPKDNKFLELAVSANASCIVTGDKDLLVLNPFRNIPILNPVDFINNY